MHRYLVVDEADRLLMQSYQDWLAEVLHSRLTAPEIVMLGTLQ